MELATRVRKEKGNWGGRTEMTAKKSTTIPVQRREPGTFCALNLGVAPA